MLSRRLVTMIFRNRLSVSSHCLPCFRCKHPVAILVSVFVVVVLLNVCREFYPDAAPTRLWLRGRNVDVQRLLRVELRPDVRSPSSGDWNRTSCDSGCDVAPEAVAARRVGVYSRTGVDCAAMFDGDEAEMLRAQEYMSRNERETLTAEDYISRTRNCSDFRSSRGYFARPLSKEEAEFPIAFSILMYQDIYQVERLLRAVYMPQNFYCVHVDSKASPTVIRAVEALVACFDNVILASRLESVYWGHISIIYAEMRCLEDLLKFRWRYFINLSGQMFPTHSNRQLVEILKLYNGANDIEGSYKRSDHIWLQLRNWLSWRHSDRLNLNLMTFYPKGQPPYNVTIYKGSNQVVMTRAFALYFLYSKVSQDIVEWFVDTLAPDEYIWPTINHNPQLHAPGGYKGDPEKKVSTARASIWLSYSDQAEWSWKHWECQGKWVREICIFGVGDLPWLRNRPELFVNKFHSDYEWLGYDCMEELILNRTVGERRRDMDLTYYRDLSFVKDKSTLVTPLEESIAFLRSVDDASVASSVVVTRRT